MCHFSFFNPTNEHINFAGCSRNPIILPYTYIALYELFFFCVCVKYTFSLFTFYKHTLSQTDLQFKHNVYTNNCCVNIYFVDFKETPLLLPHLFYFFISLLCESLWNREYIVRYMHAPFFLFCIPAFRLCIIRRPRLVFFFFV